MPRKKPTARNAGGKSPTTPKNRRAMRPDPKGVRSERPGQDPMRDRRFDRRPPKFPGRLGGR